MPAGYRQASGATNKKKRMKTRERILQTALLLFNEQGEPNVSTLEIANELEISPGNLYYHFRNKQMIIAELFAQYEAQVDSFLRPPEGRALTVADKTFYLEALLAAMWHYRFLHRDLEHLLETDVQLAERYRAFAARCMQAAAEIYRGFAAADILAMNDQQIEALVLNSWIILTSWVRFLCTVRSNPGDLSEELMRRGVYQILALESGYVTEAAREAVQALLQRLHVPMDAVVG